MSKHSTRPPNLFLKFFKWFCDPRLHKYLEGDLLELFEDDVNTRGYKAARRRFAWEVIKLFRPNILRSINGQNKLNQLGMLKNYYKMAFRSFKKDRVHAFINIFGIATGMAAVILIVQYTSFEFSYDSFHERKTDIFRVDRSIIREGSEPSRYRSTTYGLGPELLESVAGLQSYVRTHPLEGGAVITTGGGISSQKQFFEEQEKLFFVDQTFFETFDFELLQGSKYQLVDDLRSVVITEKAWRKYFPNIQEPTGHFLKIDGGRYPGRFRVSGVLRDLPQNSQFAGVDFFLPLKGLLTAEQYTEGDGWSWSNFVTYVVKDPNADIDGIASSAKNIINDRKDESERKVETNVVMTPFLDIHLRDQTPAKGITEQELSFFLTIGFFIIVVAWLNYINLSTAQAMKRAKEVGIRKVVGAARTQLVIQFGMEAFIVNAIGLILALVISYFALPLLERLTEHSFKLGEYITFSYWLKLGAVFLFGTVLSGFYPAWVLSHFSPASVIKGATSTKSRKFGLRQVLVTFQLIIAVFLISGTWSVYQQLRFMQNQDLGLQVDQVLNVRAPFVYENEETVTAQMDLFKEKLRTIPAVQEMALSAAIPGGEYNWSTNLEVEGSDDEAQGIQMMFVDDNFHTTYGIELMAGRFHEEELQSIEHQVVVNETLVEKFNLGSPEEALGRKMKSGNTLLPIIGVMKDFHWNSLKDEKIPTLFYYTKFGQNLSVKVSTENLAKTMAAVEAHYADFFPDNPFDYHFMDEYFNNQYKEDQQFGTMFTTFSVIAIIIAGLGLFGLASFTLSLKIKEISIRKILGAKISSILMLLFKDYLFLIGLASIIAMPVLYLLLKDWLKDFAYRIDITPDLFVMPVILLAAITLATIGYQCIRAAIVNPASSLRRE